GRRRRAAAGGVQGRAAGAQGAGQGRSAVGGERLQERIAGRDRRAARRSGELEVAAAVGDCAAVAVRAGNRIGDNRVFEGQRGPVLNVAAVARRGVGGDRAVD